MKVSPEALLARIESERAPARGLVNGLIGGAGTWTVILVGRLALRFFFHI